MLLLYSGILRGVVRGTSHRGALLCQLCSSSGLLSFEEQSGSWNAGASAHGTPETTVLKTNFPMVMARWRERSYHMFSGPLVYNHRVPFFFLIFPPQLLVVIFFFLQLFASLRVLLLFWDGGSPLALAVGATACSAGRGGDKKPRSLCRVTRAQPARRNLSSPGNVPSWGISDLALARYRVVALRTILFSFRPAALFSFFFFFPEFSAHSLR